MSGNSPTSNFPLPASPGKRAGRRRVCFVRMNYFPEEAHVRKNAEALIEAGYQVDVICLRDKGERASQTVKGARVHRLPLMHKRTSKLRYVFEYAAFFVMASWLLTWLHLRRRYAIVEAYNVPDAIVFVALLPRLLGARIVLYMFEATPEMYIDRFELKPGGFIEKMLRFQERISVRFAHRAIVEGPYEREMRGLRGVDASKIEVVMNVPESHLFQPNGAEPDGHYQIITHGSLLKRYGIQTLIEAVPAIRADIPDLRVWVVGDGEYREELEALAREHGVDDVVQFTGWIKHEQVSGYIDRCAQGIVPMLYNQLPNKLFEYVAMGKPCVVGDVPSIRRAFNDTEVLYYDTGDAQQLAANVLRIYRDPEAAAAMAARAKETYRRYTWDVMRGVYIAVHDDVLSKPKKPAEQTETA
jgi:glycosyltransferase involved in cell wall biosynthesis